MTPEEKEKLRKLEEERLEALREAEEQRRKKYEKMEKEREKMRQGIRDKVGNERPNAVCHLRNIIIFCATVCFSFC